MSRAMRLLLVVPVVGALLAGGCGIPDNTGVMPVGPGPSSGVSSGEGIAVDRHGRESTSEPGLFVRYYLEAAAGDQAGAIERVKQFLAPPLAKNFKAPGDIKVINLVEDPLVNFGSDEVTLKAQTVGLLNSKGILEPASDFTETEYKMTVSEIAGRSGLFVTKAPPVLLLSDDALNGFYNRRAIYFWDLEGFGLVPDLRYLPKEMPPEQAPQEIVKWLIDGPSGGLDGVVQPLPEGTVLNGNIPAADNDKLQINLSAQAVQPPDDPKALDRLRRQLMWSLQPGLLPRTLELRIGSQDQNDYDSTDYLDSNEAYRLADTPERFVIYNGQIRRISGGPSATEAVPVIKPDANKSVQAAAIATANNRRYAALVVNAAGKHELRVGGATIGEQADLARVSLPGGSPGQPVWAITADDPQTGGVGLIAVGGRLYSFTSDGAAVTAVSWPGPAGLIAAMGVAPDGRRLAVVVGGRVYVAGLSISGDGLQISNPRQVLTADLRQVTAVDWSSETWLVVAGSRADRNRVGIVDLPMDGSASIGRIEDIGSESVSYLAAYPARPLTSSTIAGTVEYVANGATFDVLTNPVRIGIGNLADPVPNPPNGVVPTAPFFLR
jgi:hypothetical protein